MANSLKYIRRGLDIAAKLPSSERSWIRRELAADPIHLGVALEMLRARKPLLPKSRKPRRKPLVFLSYNHRDRAAVQSLSHFLQGNGIEVWLDERDLRIGESIATTVSAAVVASDFVIAALSQNSIASSWVQHELQVALTEQLKAKVTKILPVKLDRCQVPAYLIGYLSADLSTPKKALEGRGRLVESIHLLFRERDA